MYSRSLLTYCEPHPSGIEEEPIGTSIRSTHSQSNFSSLCGTRKPYGNTSVMSSKLYCLFPENLLLVRVLQIGNSYKDTKWKGYSIKKEGYPNSDDWHRRFKIFSISLLFLLLRQLTTMKLLLSTHMFLSMIFRFADVIQANSVDNDVCVNAIPLTINVTAYGNFSSATLDTAEVEGICDLSLLPPPVPGIWYTIVGTGQRLLARSCEYPQNQDISVYKGSCGRGNLTCVVKGFGPCGSPRLEFDSEAGTTYYILHVSNKNDTLIDITVSVTALPPCGFICSVLSFFRNLIDSIVVWLFF